MNTVFVKLLNMSIAASLIAVAVIIVRLIFRKMPKKYFCILWAFVAVRLVLPFSFESSVSALNLLNRQVVGRGEVEAFTEVTDPETAQTSIEVFRPVREPVQVPAYGNSVVETEARPDPIRFSAKPIVILWLAGLFAMLGFAEYSYLRIRRETTLSIPAGRHIYKNDDITTPFILGIFVPKIYIPTGLPEDVASCVIAHEHAHIRRLDHIWKPLGYILLSVYWFNPVLWTAYILLCRDIEAACDEKVIENMEGDARAFYSEALLFCASERRMITACPLAFGEVGVKARIKNVLKYKKPAVITVAALAVAGIIVGICFLTDPKNHAEDGESTVAEDIMEPGTEAETESESVASVENTTEIVSQSSSDEAEEKTSEVQSDNENASAGAEYEWYAPDETVEFTHVENGYRFDLENAQEIEQTVVSFFEVWKNQESHRKTELMTDEVYEKCMEFYREGIHGKENYFSRVFYANEHECAIEVVGFSRAQTLVMEKTGDWIVIGDYFKDPFGTEYEDMDAMNAVFKKAAEYKAEQAFPEEMLAELINRAKEMVFSIPLSGSDNATEEEKSSQTGLIKAQRCNKEQEAAIYEILYRQGSIIDPAWPSAVISLESDQPLVLNGNTVTLEEKDYTFIAHYTNEGLRVEHFVRY